MASPTPEELTVALGRLTASELAGVLRAVLVNMVMLEGVEDDPQAELSEGEPMYGQLGGYARPEPPTKAAEETPLKPAGYAEAVGLRVGDRVHPVAYRDLRLSARVNPKEGEVGLAQYRGGFVSLAPNADARGTNIVIYAPQFLANGTADKAHVIALDSSDAQDHVALIHGAGHSITLTKEGKIVIMNAAGDAFVNVEDGKITLNAVEVVSIGGTLLGTANPVGADFVALATLVLANLVAMKTAFDAHTHPVPGVTVGVGSTTSSAPSSPFPAATPVASSNVKASF